MKKLNIVAWAFAIFVCVLALALVTIIASPNFAAGAAGIPDPNVRYQVGGGDCSADRASWDLYTPRDSYCDPLRYAKLAPVLPTNTPVPTAIPTMVSTLVPTQVHTDEQTYILPAATDVPTQGSEDPTGVAIKPSPAPTDAPSATEPPPSNDDVCKNKNAGKDGTPTECNAGIGQEKQE